MGKVHETILEIDLKALKHNFNFLKSKLQSNTKLLAVVKAFAYGSDANEIAKYLEELKVDYFAVAYTYEGVALRDAGIKTPILVLHPQPINFKTIIERCLEPSIYSHKILNAFINTSEEESQNNYPIHLKFNTGLNRIGFNANDVETVMSKIGTTESIKIKSVFSHLGASEDLNEKTYTNNQIKSFDSIVSKIAPKLNYQPIYHMCNTSGILNYPEAHLDMVRSGIGLYGFGNSEKEDSNFKPVATLKSVVSQIHSIESGESVGYNRAFKATKNLRSATIPIGHADGIGRQYGNGRGFVTINNQPAFILGNVCMDMIMVDVTEIDCQEGDEVVVFGKSPTAVEFSKTVNSISYEIITAISQRIKRVYLK
ncbi:alanine racemase [Hanstruepera ponticola]|uniref:alanine racemase n=1 Tax=Hanstruepera ponticola TaxID=2042995 RepID=UPI0017865AC2|nr:alanine racemase [Hanstruepera ponticola]